MLFCKFGILKNRIKMAKRKVLSRWDYIWLIIIALILLTALLNRLGVKVVNTSEKSEIIDHTAN